MEITHKASAFSRRRKNELNKGYYPTLAKDVESVLKALRPDFGYGRERQTLAILDPCAGRGEFLGAAVRTFRKALPKDSPHQVLGYAVELDAERCAAIRGAAQKVHGSFFDTDVAGFFQLILLNPPYHKEGEPLLTWVARSARLLAHQGMMVLVVPDYELAGLSGYLKKEFGFLRIFKSEEHGKFRQLVIYAGKSRSSYGPGDDPEAGGWEKRSESRDQRSLVVKAGSCVNRPFITCRDLAGHYRECGEKVAQEAERALERSYPADYDREIRPLATLRPAHAVQLAAMNSSVEPVEVNGAFYLAKFMLVKSAETFSDPESGTETTVEKPVVEPFLMDREGRVAKPAELQLDTLDLTTQLSTVLLSRLNLRYPPLHEIGTDSWLEDELKGMGLLPPQREAARAVLKGFREGALGVGVRGGTGTGKTWVAKSVHRLLGSRRTVMVTEPGLVSQLAEEFSGEPFPLHVVDSWAKAKELARKRPPGMYLIAWSRLRMHPKYRLAVVEKTSRRAGEGGATADVVNACPACFAEAPAGLKAGDKPRCGCCGGALYSYVPENDRPQVTFSSWSRGGAPRARTENRELPYIRLLKKIPFALAIFDELHNAGNLISNQGAAFIRLAAHCPLGLGLTATTSNGIARSFFNILWGLSRRQMAADGWHRGSATDFQTKFGAFRRVKKTDEHNRHRGSERVTTHDSPGVSPAALAYILPVFVNLDAGDFTDLPAVEKDQVRCAPHPEVEGCEEEVREIVGRADIPKEDRYLMAAVRDNALLRLSDTFSRFDYPLTFRGETLGVVKRHLLPAGELLEKERALLGFAEEAKGRGERLLVYTGVTQKIDMRPALAGLLREVFPLVEVLPDSVPPDKVVSWFRECRGGAVIASMHRATSGLNLSQFLNMWWHDYTTDPRKAAQGDGRIRRVNTAALHRAMFGEVRSVHYRYATSSKWQELRLSYTLEKILTAMLAEGEVPEIDPSVCGSASSFSALMARALREGRFDYPDPGALLKRLTQKENARLALSQPERLEVTGDGLFAVIRWGREGIVQERVREEELEALIEEGAVEYTLFGPCFRAKKGKRRR